MTSFGTAHLEDPQAIAIGGNMIFVADDGDDLVKVFDITFSEKELKNRFRVINPEEFKRLEDLNKSIILIFGHYASWEWSIVLQNYINFKGLAVYKKLANKHFDKLVRDIRTKFNTDLISTKETISIINNNEALGVKSITGFLSDQSPKLTKDVYWGKFMNIEINLHCEF